MTLHTIMRSRNEELTEEPTITCATGMPSTSETFLTLSGDDGHAMRGSSLLKSISSYSSYPASVSALHSLHTCSLPWLLRNSSVLWSEGNTVVVTPSSAPMLAIVALSVTESVSTP